MNGRLIEELSLNQWQPISTLLHGGWVLRFADGYTKRANSIQPLRFEEGEDLVEKLLECEALYAAREQPAIFKLTPYAEPEGLDGILAERGYRKVDPTSVQILRLDGEPDDQAYGRSLMQLNGHLGNEVDANGTTEWVEQPGSITHLKWYAEAEEEWLKHFCRMNGSGDRNRRAMERMLSHLATAKGFVTLYNAEGEAVACGLGVVERGVLGLYDVITDAKHRNKGYGRQLIRSLLAWGRETGAHTAFLAVVVGNEPAWRIYAQAGFTEIYRYWYRVKDIGPVVR